MSDNMDVYTTICAPRFKTIEDRQEAMLKDVGDIKQKLFNGMSDALVDIRSDIKDMKETQEKRKRSRSLWVRDIILTLLGSGGIISFLLPHIIGGG